MYQTLPTFKRHMKKDLKRLTTFLRGLKRRNVKGLSYKTTKLNKEAFAKIDCLKCANCCKVMTPTYNKADVKRISAHVGMTEKEYWKKYLVRDENKDIVHKKTPCHFLLSDNMCGIYDIRPNDCRGFPHTNKKDFLFQREFHTQNLEYCPITYHVVKRLEEIVVK
jgi:Fe-S-cluster containining protein